MHYVLNKIAYAEWYRNRFQAIPEAELTAAESVIILELDDTSKLTSSDEPVVHVRVVIGSIGVSIGMEFAVAKRCLVPKTERRAR